MDTTVHTRDDVFERLSQLQADLNLLGVKRIGLFGSFVRNTPKADSDVDLLVEFEPEMKNIDNFMALSFLLEEALERQVELVTLEALSPYIGPHILREVAYVDFSR